MHATISVICNKHKVLSNGESPIVLRIAKGGKRAIKSLGISINPSHWDEQKEQAKPICPNKKQIDLLVLKTKTEYQKKVLEKSVNDEDFTPQSLLFDEQKSIKVATVEEFYQAIIKELRAKGNIGNSYAYLNSYNSLKNFNKGKKLTYPFGYIDVLFLKKYESWLRKRENKYTTLSYQFRTLRSVYNKAIKENLVKAHKNPFIEFKVSKFNTKTQKRALSKEEILKIINADTSQQSEKRKLAQDIFTFSYLCGGISFVDIANLSPNNIINNRIVYSRQKTNSPINLTLSEQALNIIQKYDEYCKKAFYLFPILDGNRHITPMQKSNRVHKICHQINQELRKLGDELEISAEVTTYVARHSFASILKNSGVNVALISQALGHTDLATTQIYLDSFGNDQVDEAMKNLL